MLRFWNSMNVNFSDTASIKIVLASSFSREQLTAVELIALKCYLFISHCVTVTMDWYFAWPVIAVMILIGSLMTDRSRISWFQKIAVYLRVLPTISRKILLTERDCHAVLNLSCWASCGAHQEFNWRRTQLHLQLHWMFRPLSSAVKFLGTLAVNLANLWEYFCHS